MTFFNEKLSSPIKCVAGLQGLFRNREFIVGHEVKIAGIAVMQSDWNSSKTETFHEPTTYEPHV